MSIDNIDSGLRVTDEYEDEDDDAVAARTAPPRRVHRRSYHLVYSRSYGCPVLLIRGVKCDGARVMNHAEMEASLVSASTRGAEDGDDVDRRRDALVLGESGLSVFAPWEHPHASQGGGWLGVHPCETRDAMALLLGGDEQNLGGTRGGTCRRGYRSSPPPSPTSPSPRTDAQTKHKAPRDNERL